MKKLVFHNDNKRTAFMVPNKEAVNYMVKLVTEDINEDEIAVLIREYSQLSIR